MEEGLGFSLEDLLYAKKKFTAAGATCELYELNAWLYEPTDDPKDLAYVLVMRNGISAMLGGALGKGKTANDLEEELKGLTWDSEIMDRKGNVTQKRARHNLVFAEHGTKANLEEGQGSIIAYKEVPLL